MSRRPFDNRPPVPTGPRTNRQIRVPEVRIIDERGEQLGVVTIDDAIAAGVADIAMVERQASLEGRTMFAILARGRTQA